MSKTVFKVGDRVFCILNGHGVVVEVRDINTFSVGVQFDNDEDGGILMYTSDGRYYEHVNPTLSFTEYTLDGFSQERPLELPEVGEEIMVSLDKNIWVLGKFTSYSPQLEYGIEVMFEDGDMDNYKYFKRLR